MKLQKSDWFCIVGFCAMVLCLSWGVILASSGFDNSEAVRILSDQGYTDVEITGWRPMMAGKGDTYSTGFRAKSPAGREVTGAVTGGWFKGRTIRLD